MIFIFLYYLIINVIGLALMAIDKGRAKRQEWRIKETTLWSVSLIGGALGSYIGMRLYRHKTKHTSFKVGLPLLVSLHFGLVLYIAIFW
ncbi:uncharacterized membrane protein YsdA (DUF1294 family) [Metabacillus crassostreae]|uniref:DUF1294 domain-containing protein n=1 Tax=Metabacillus crassostreae TaxID=929098 RepID=UPI0019593A2A|nr:DUF1294 domain-containing protein [Metabacillus crassostreae]MBM7605679.1 uncharacterized membrane protein YsdA (DUF1294 family) [Metabacillus crassostreae]